MAVNEQVLEHKMRKIIFKYVSSNPGVSFGTIESFVDMNASTLKYHLNYLEKTRKILSKKEGKKRCYYSIESPVIDIDPTHNHDKLNKKQERIFNTVKRSPGITQKAIVKKLNLKQNTVSYNLTRLIELGIIWKISKNGKPGYEPVTKENLKAEIMDRLILRLYRNEIDQEAFKKIKRRLEELD